VQCCSSDVQSRAAISLVAFSGLLGTLLGMLLMTQSFAGAFQSGHTIVLVVQVAWPLSLLLGAHRRRYLRLLPRFSRLKCAASASSKQQLSQSASNRLVLEEQTAELLQPGGAGRTRRRWSARTACSPRQPAAAARPVYDIMGAQATVCRCALHLHMLAV